VRAEVARVRELGDAELRAWSSLQRGSAVYRNPFFRPEFALAVAAVREAWVAVVEDAGRVVGVLPFERGRWGAGRALGQPFADYQGPLLAAGAEVDPVGLVRASGLRVWSFDHVPEGLHGFEPHARAWAASPTLDLSGGFEAWLEARRAVSEIRAAQRKARKLAREVGELRLEPDGGDEAHLAQLVGWKRRQYAETGVRDVLSAPAGVELLRRVRSSREPEFAGMLSVLYAGDVVAAVHLGLRSGPVWHSWFPVFNPELHRYSPGLVLMLELARAAPGLGLTELDLGKGEARYKQALATGSVALGEGWVSAGAAASALLRVRGGARRALRSAGVHRALRRALRRA
jgi:CelD/BcsL family acetyltransferase involved in cellulose biosynthesis